jgi:hypothetical protein
MYQKSYVGLLCGILLLLPMNQVKSQSTNTEKQGAHPWWVNLGAGPANIGTDFAMTAGMIYCYQFEQSVISARMLGATNINPTVQKIDPTSTKYKMADYGILYGPIWHSGCCYMSVSGGIGLVRAAYEMPTKITTNTSISLPLEAQLFWRPTYFSGIGIYVYTSINFEKSLYGMMLCCQLGVW